MRKSRFLWSHFLTHPGTWVGFALLVVGIGILFAFMAPAILPAIAPTLLLIAGVTTLFALFSFPFYVMRYIDRLGVEQEDIRNDSKDGSAPSLSFLMLEHFGNWITKHPVQFFFVCAGIVAFTLALWLTVSFFTGGTTLLMAPVFAAIAAPFIANSTIGFASIPLALAITSGAIFTIAPLFLTNIVKRFLALFGGSDNEPKRDNVSNEFLIKDEQTNRDRGDSNAAFEGDSDLLSHHPNIFYRLTYFSGRIEPDERKVSDTFQNNSF